MQVTILRDEGLNKTLRLVVPADAIQSAVDAELKRIGQSVKIAGFRPGHVPVKILQQRYGKSVLGDVLRDVINRTMTDALVERDFRPALAPQIENQEYEEGGDLSFDVKVEVLPDVPEIDFSGVDVEREVFEIEESEIDEGINRLAERSPKTTPLSEKAKAEKGHVVTMDFKGSIDGVLFEGGTAENFNIELGSGRLIAGFEDQLIGIKAGESRTVSVPFPADYFNQELAGKDAQFEVTAREVAALEKPEVNDEFAKSKGFSDLRALREAVRDQLKKDFNGMVRTRLKKQLFDALEPRCTFLAPDGMVQMEFDSIWQRLQSAREQGDETLEGKTDDELREEYRAIADRRVRLGILLAEIARREKLGVTREEMSRALIQHASQYPGQEQRVMEFYRQNPDRLDDLRGPILEEKAVDWILGKVKLNDRQVTTQELLESDAEEALEAEASAKSKKPAKAKKADAETKEKPAAKKGTDAEGEEKPKAAKKKPAAKKSAEE